jgi:hypothetical protein
VYRVHVAYRVLEATPGLGVVQHIVDGGERIPRGIVHVVEGIFDKVGIGGTLAGLAKVVDFCKVAGEVVGSTTEVGR